MKLLIDIGNTSCRWAWWDETGFVAGGFARHGGRFERGLAQVPEVPVPDAVWVANVAGERAAEAVTQRARAAWDVAPTFVTAAPRGHGVVNGYREPTRLGADRWAALVGARALRAGPVCIADCGTALTIDLLDEGGQHRGGLILPGLALMRRAVERGTRGVRLDAEAVPQDGALLGRSTGEGVAVGTLYAAVALIDRVIADLAVELGAAPLCLITGGDGPTLAPLIGAACRHEPQLTLQGLAVLAGADPERL
ncbi:type III pantothenate kinase [Ectothiorhodospiraceae bacterium 2226]|nr:type III pantothenate kinase [Ectothiorhodospiraceae bacterium 2226]